MNRALLFCALCSIAHAAYYIYADTDPELIRAAQSIGERAKINYIKKIIGVFSDKKRRGYYLDGIEMCNNIGGEHTHRMVERAEHESRTTDAFLLEKIGLKHFTAQFMTLPPRFMKEVAHMACSKHEEQLQCGSIFEGDEITRRRIDDLRTIGNHKMMFDIECVNSSFVPDIYPCVGRNVADWSRPCSGDMDAYWKLRESVNAKIMDIYETAVSTVKKLKMHGETTQETLKEFIFHDAMRNIAKLEGEKCALFKKMRDCVLPLLLRHCGATAAAAIDTSISIGYLRTERKERLQLDFDNFSFPQDPRCDNL